MQIASALGEFGASLAIVARKPAELDAAVEQAPMSRGRTAVGFVADLGNPEAIAGLIDRVLARFGRIDILVNNAGTVWGAPAEDYPLDGWNKVIDLNVTGLFLLTQAVAREAFLKQGKGAVINLASIEGLAGPSSGSFGNDRLQHSQGRGHQYDPGASCRMGPAQYSGQCAGSGILSIQTGGSGAGGAWR